jgi:hypothetical protein
MSLILASPRMGRCGLPCTEVTTRRCGTSRTPRGPAGWLVSPPPGSADPHGDERAVRPCVTSRSLHDHNKRLTQPRDLQRHFDHDITATARLDVPALAEAVKRVAVVAEHHTQVRLNLTQTSATPAANARLGIAFCGRESDDWCRYSRR